MTKTCDIAQTTMPPKDHLDWIRKLQDINWRLLKHTIDFRKSDWFLIPLQGFFCDLLACIGAVRCHQTGVLMNTRVATSSCIQLASSARILSYFVHGASALGQLEQNGLFYQANQHYSEAAWSSKIVWKVLFWCGKSKRSWWNLHFLSCC